MTPVMNSNDQKFMGAAVRQHLNTEYQDDERFFRMSRIIHAIYEQGKTWHLHYIRKWFHDATR